MIMIRQGASKWFIRFVAVASLSSMCACASDSDGTSDSDVMAAREAEGEKLTDADEALEMSTTEAADEEVAEPDFPWGKIFAFKEGTNTKVGRDWFPVGYDYVGFPVAIVKMVVAMPNKVGDWFRGWNVAEFMLPNETSSPRKVEAKLTLSNLNWYFSRGRASLRVCNVNASGAEYGCANLGSVKRGTRTTSYRMDEFAGRERSIKLRHYARSYPLTIPPGESLRVRVKHKLECNVDDLLRNSSDQQLFRACAVDPVPSIQFTK